MDAMAEGIRRIDATTAKYSEFADAMDKNQPVSACKKLSHDRPAGYSSSTQQQACYRVPRDSASNTLQVR